VQGLADHAQKFTYYTSQAAPDPLIANGWTVPDYYNYQCHLIARMPSLFVLQFVSSAVNLILSIEIQKHEWLH